MAGEYKVKETGKMTNDCQKPGICFQNEKVQAFGHTVQKMRNKEEEDKSKYKGMLSFFQSAFGKMPFSLKILLPSSVEIKQSLLIKLEDDAMIPTK